MEVKTFNDKGCGFQRNVPKSSGDKTIVNSFYIIIFQEIP
jgi:hypothetical protein